MGTTVKFEVTPASVSVEINNVVERLKNDPVAEVARRFLKLFDDHGIAQTQIQRLLPDVTINAIRSNELLTAALTNDVLAQCTELFGVQRAWLETVTDQVYPFRSCYKNHDAFCLEVARLSTSDVWNPVRVYCLDQELNRQSAKHQPLVVVLAEKTCDWDGGGIIERYRPLTVPWYWDDPITRIPLKAMIRIAYDEFGITTIPLISTSHSNLDLLAKGKLVPPVDRGRRRAYIEDYVLNEKESAVSKEADELNAVHDYINRTGFRELAKSARFSKPGEAVVEKKKKRRK